MFLTGIGEGLVSIEGSTCIRVENPHIKVDMLELAGHRKNTPWQCPALFSDHMYRGTIEDFATHWLHAV